MKAEVDNEMYVEKADEETNEKETPVVTNWQTLVLRGMLPKTSSGYYDSNHLPRNAKIRR